MREEVLKGTGIGASTLAPFCLVAYSSRIALCCPSLLPVLKTLIWSLLFDQLPWPVLSFVALFSPTASHRHQLRHSRKLSCNSRISRQITDCNLVIVKELHRIRCVQGLIEILGASCEFLHRGIECVRTLKIGISVSSIKDYTTLDLNVHSVSSFYLIWLQQALA